ncbi:metabolite traffic protein EboE [Actinomadura algeriensis]|uniref:Sugar phosphate isomerase/epimerase n=1 Tax=Actinomadura algeriensis TaxID=1679523 RepID=A0ABR9JU44_9ACTN|nr:metabolite traffic protein EboE [Actinomadura algeriensis]MBE1533924.1 sugar phosphate isomerase/epimerase [Actinomadura algeriensis]
MRFRHPDGTTVHLGYCTNVHPAEDVPGVIAQLRRYAHPVRERLGSALLGTGLWLGSTAVREMTADERAVKRLRDVLDELGLETVTLNGFPYEGFQAGVVKRRVYSPDWTGEARLRHTVDLARILARLLPDDVGTGSVSTVPLAWRTPWPDGRAAAAAANLRRLEAELAELEDRTGRRVRVGFEPEPGCVVGTTAQAVRHLPGGSPYLGVCLDACHLAVEFEEPGPAAARLTAAGLPVVKLQASCAVEADRPAAPEQRRALRRFVEPRFLHQTREHGAAAGVDDLAEALDGGLPGARPWRVHFHVPVHADPAAPLRATRDVLRDALAVLLGGERALTSHVEVETYTWAALPSPPAGERALIEGIAAEIDWVRNRLTGLGLTEETT